MFVDTSSYVSCLLTHLLGVATSLKEIGEPRESMTTRVIKLGIIKLFMVGLETVDIKFLTPPRKYIFDPRGPRPPPFTIS